MSDVYPTTDFIKEKENSSVPSTLKTFIDEVVKVPIKQLSLMQAKFPACRPRTVMPLQFVLAVAVDNHLASKWLNNTLHNLGFAVSYDEVSFYDCLIYQTRSFSVDPRISADFFFFFALSHFQYKGFMKAFVLRICKF